MYTKYVFAHQLKSILENQGMTQCALSIRMNTTEATISRYVSGDRLPDIATAVKLAQVLNVSMDTLIGAEPPTESDVTPEVDILLNCYDRITVDDRHVLWALLDRYLSPEQRTRLDSLQQL